MNVISPICLVDAGSDQKEFDKIPGLFLTKDTRVTFAGNNRQWGRTIAVMLLAAIEKLQVDGIRIHRLEFANRSKLFYLAFL